jgi:hypothetical protein
MKKMKFLILSAILLAGTTPVLALTITDYHAPTVSSNQGDVDAAFANAIGQINTEIANIDATPEKMATAMANSAVYSNHSSTQRGYQGYDLFALSVGSMIGFQAPSNDPEAYKDLESDLKRDGDINAGANLQAWSCQLGLNTSKYLVEDLYMAFKFGILKYDMSAGADFSYGKSDMTMNINGDVNITGASQTAPGYIKVDAGVNDTLPDWVKPKLMAGLGLSLGPVMIDVPVTYYFSNGFNVGVTAGIVW